MKPNFALNLTDDQIALLQRAEQGWSHLGSAVFGADDMDAQLATVLETANALAPRKGISTKIVIPNSQILYTTLQVAPGPAAAMRDDIRAALVGRTPYDIDDLVFDFVGEGPEVQVAVVAQETLDQAEGFAVQYQFRPVSFVSVPPDGAFPGEPFFGQTKFASTVLGKGRKVERDAEAVVVMPMASSQALSTPEVEAVVPPPEAVEAFPEASVEAAAMAEVPDAIDAPAMPVAEVAPPAPVAISDEAEQPVAATMTAVVAEEVAEPAPAPQPDPAPAFEIAAVTHTPEPAPQPSERALNSVVDPHVPDPDEAPFADVSDTDMPEAAKADQVDADLPPAPSTAALMAFASRRAATADAGNAATLPPRPFSETTIPGAMGARPAARLSGNARPEPRVTMGSALNTPPAAAAGKKAQRKAVVGGAAAPVVAATIAANDAPRKPLTKPGGTFASSAPVRGKPRFLGLILTGILILFLALLAAWSSFFLASNTDSSVPAPTAVVNSDVPDAGDEALADGQVPEDAVLDASATQPTPAVPATDIAAGPEPADPPAEQTSDTAAPQTAGPAPETGVVTTAPAPEGPAAETDEILLSTADTPLALQQAAVLGAPDLQADALPAPQMAPPPFGTVYEFNANGTVRAVPEGIMTPDGVRLVAGEPAKVPPARPAAIATAAVAEPAPAAPAAADDVAADDTAAVVGADPALADARPRARPAGLVPPGTDDDAALQGTQPILASSPRPLPRPATIVAANAEPEPARASDAASLAAASAAAGSAAEAIIQDLAAVEPVAAVTPSGSRLAVSVSRIPAPRPRDMERAVAAALAAATRAPEPEPEPEPAPQQAAAATPEAEPEPEAEAVVASGPTSRSVADQATFVNALNLSRINLIGVYGTQSNRYALIRQANGRYKRVEVGDRIDGGVVAAITSNEVRYEKGGRLIALQMPEG